MKTSFLAWAILIAGLANAAVFGWGFKQFNEYFRYKSFDSNMSAGNSFEVLTLSKDRFAIVERSSISVYQVDGNGEVNRLSDVYTSYEELEKYSRAKRDKTPAPTR